MNSRTFALASLSAVAALLCSCSANDRQAAQNQGRQASDVSSPPDISPSAAPGVAFNFAYEFSLPDEAIAATQEAHAAACESLGLNRCRITGMSYSVDQDQQVSAELDLKVDPVIARGFGKSAQGTVVNHDGKLIRLEISSSDEGSAIEQATKEKSSIATQIAELRTELGKTKAGSDAHASLLAQIQSLESRGAEQSQTVAAGQAALASTPMQFHYYGRGGVPGFRGNPIRQAWQTFVTTIVWLVGALLQALAVLVPLAFLLALMLILWRSRPIRALRAWTRREADSEE